MMPDTCAYCNHPLRPIVDDEGNTALWRGFLLRRCKNGHEFVGIPYEALREGEVLHEQPLEAKAA